MATDISKVSGMVAITVGSGRPVHIRTVDYKYYFNQDGTNLFIRTGDGSNFNILFSDLTISGSAPATVAAAYVSLAAIFS